jgi:galactokinase/mevalonate kinase-like predicted kinase
MIITRTPLRISFFGGGTDYPVWYREHGGAVLSTTIDKCCLAGGSPFAPQRITRLKTFTEQQH